MDNRKKIKKEFFFKAVWWSLTGIWRGETI